MKKSIAVMFAMAIFLSVMVDPAGAEDEGVSGDSTGNDESSDQQAGSDSKAAKKEFKKYLRALNKESAGLASQSADGEQDDIEFYCCQLGPEFQDDATGCTTRADNPHISTSRRRSGQGTYIKGKGVVQCNNKVSYIHLAVKLQTQRWWGTWQGATRWYKKGKADRTEWYHSAELQFGNHQGRFRTLVASEVTLYNGEEHYAKALSRHVKITNPN